MSRNLRLLLALMILGAIATGAGVTYSAFTSTSNNAGNSFASGTVSLRDNDAKGALLTITAGKPGDSDTGCIRVTYAGSLNSGVRIYARVTGALAPSVTLTVTRGTDTSAAFKSCAGFTPDPGVAGGVIYSGLLSAFPASYDTGIVDGAPETWTTSEAHSYKFVVSVNDDNAAQGQSAAVAFTWEARNL